MRKSKESPVKVTFKRKTSISKNLFKYVKKEERAQIRSYAGATAGLWLDAVSSLQLYTTIAQFQTAALFCLGAWSPQLSNIKKCISKCDHDFDAE